MLCFLGKYLPDLDSSPLFINSKAAVFLCGLLYYFLLSIVIVYEKKANKKPNKNHQNLTMSISSVLIKTSIYK